MDEGGLDHEVQRLLTDYDLLAYQVGDSRRASLKGWPDLVILGRAVLFRELKADTGRVASAQTQVGRLLAAGGADWAVWRPRDLTSGRIERELEAVAWHHPT